MKRLIKLRNAFMRWDRLLSAAVVGLPFALMSVFGFIWLLEHGWLFLFVGISLTLGLLMTGARWLARRRARRHSQRKTVPDDLAVEADPDWLSHEQVAFNQACRHIETLTEEVQPWEALPDHALAVVNRVIKEMGGEGKTALDFSVPEALLLLERSASRYRQHLRHKVPFSDQLSISALYWIWRQRDRLSLIWKLADGGRRLARMAINPTRGVLQEVEQLVAGGNSDYLTEQMMGTMQAILLEEVAYAAVELYSGRLRFSDAELLEIQLGTTEADRSRLAQPDEPLRILIVGQVSAGKSTVLNVLLEAEKAETDTASTTPGLITYETEIDDIPCHFLDSKGVDGSEDNRAELCEEMVQSDMILWLVRADRPGRDPDLKLKRVFDAWFEKHPTRRKPVVIAIATCVDQLSESWPHPEHNLPEAEQNIFAEAVNVIADELDGMKPLPVSSISPSWNIDTIIIAITSHLSEAMMVQRNRRRAEANDAGGRILKEARRGGRGVVKAARLVGGKMLKRGFSRGESMKKKCDDI